MRTDQYVEKYPKLTDKEKEYYQVLMVAAMFENHRRKQLEDEFWEYYITVQDAAYVTSLTDDEVENTAEIVVAILEEMKQVNNSGMDRAAFTGKTREIREELEEGNSKDLFVMFRTYQLLATDKMKSLVAELNKVQRVGGAWAMLISNPGFHDAICAVYEQIVDRFDDEALYRRCLYFLMRCAMRMHTVELSEKNEGKGEERQL